MIRQYFLFQLNALTQLSEPKTLFGHQKATKEHCQQRQNGPNSQLCLFGSTASDDDDKWQAPAPQTLLSK